GFAAGGPLAPGRPALVGEQGPEIVVPRFAGEVVPRRMLGSADQRPVSITINIAGDSAPAAGRESATQIALAVRRALQRAERLA
ncbi:MAG: tail tape measure protein, partial [Alphaproteobacteria bacterium]